MKRVIRSARGVAIDFDALKAKAEAIEAAPLKTAEVRKKVKEVETRRIRGFVPAAPQEPTPAQAMLIEPKKKRSKTEKVADEILSELNK